MGESEGIEYVVGRLEVAVRVVVVLGHHLEGHALLGHEPVQWPAPPFLQGRKRAQMLIASKVANATTSKDLFLLWRGRQRFRL